MPGGPCRARASQGQSPSASAAGRGGAQRSRLDQGISVSETAKAYRFLRAVLMTAADDRIIPRNPCRVRGAGEEKPDERPTLTVRQVYELADRMPGDCYRVLVLLAAFASLRWGEITALRRCDIDIQAGTVTIARQHVQLDTGGLVVTAPKSRASARTVAIPATILPAIRGHLDGCVRQSPDSLVFTGSRGGVLRRSNFRRAVKWSYTVEAIGVPGLHFHDLRHTGNTHAAATGASLRDLMDRMGHDSARGANLPAQDGRCGPGDRGRAERPDRVSGPGAQRRHRHLVMARLWHAGPV